MRPGKIKLFVMRLLGFHPVYCGWCGCFLHWSEVKDSTGICDLCAMEMMASVAPMSATSNRADYVEAVDGREPAA